MLFLIKNFIKYLNIKNKNNLICFFSESHFYKNYYIELANKLKDENNILILTSDIEEFESLKEEMQVLFIGKGFFRYLIFNIIKCDLFFMTLIDIGNNFFKSRFCNKYIYFFHAMASTHKIYTNTAFDNYEVIFTLGNFQNDEIREREKIFNLNKKELYCIGYFYLDFLKKNVNLNLSNNDTILFAPSWNYNKKNLLNDHGVEIIRELINQGLKVIFRPHPENYKHDEKIINEIVNEFTNKNFYLDNSASNIKSMEEAGSLLTDNSAISLEFTFTFNRPTFFIDYTDKIHNKNFSDMKNPTIEKIFQRELGVTFKTDEINEIKKSIKDFYIYKNDNSIKIRNFLNKYYINVEKTVSEAQKIIKELKQKD
jgi:ADP-heptose:LPS heptosyltransferase|tara:strand:+ start:6181 stop:7287 length:1107 start_codon:yes stop_codon:yes gene_type:complete